MSEVTLFCGDCLAVVPTLPAQSVDAILTDVPYGTTACSWDEVIPFEDMWRIIKHVLKPRGVFVTTASQPFTSKLVMSNLDWFKYEWVWNKRLAGNGILANYQPLKIHENICVFSGGATNYNPQKIKGKARWKGGIKDKHGTFNNSESNKTYNDLYNPISIMEFSGANMRSIRVHPTQKPVALYEYLVKTYTNEGDTVLDFCMGSGTTGVACVNTNRNFIGVELLPEYYQVASERIEKAQQQIRLPI